MNNRQRFRAIMNYEPVDRLPVWFFGTWHETLERWRGEGIKELTDLEHPPFSMDPDWEQGMWNWHGLANARPLSDRKPEVLEETETYTIVRDSLGSIDQVGKGGSSIPHTIEHALKPTRPAWEEFKTFLDPADPRRTVTGWEAEADRLEAETTDRPLVLLGGSLYGWPRGWMGVEQMCFLPYDDPVLFEEIIAHLTDLYISVLGPLTERVKFDFVYIFEDCCFRSGPLLSPDIYRKFYDRHYRRLIDFYKSRGIPFILLDSDGKVDDMIPLWMDSGVDIMFPIEVGTWNADPISLRKQFGKDLRMLGGFNKHLIKDGPEAVRTELERLRPLVEEGGFIPIPDHRIPPDCSLEAFQAYLDIYREMFDFRKCEV